MAHTVQIVIGNKDKDGTYSQGLSTDISVTESTTVRGIMTQAETHSRKLCVEKQLTFVDYKITGLE